MQDSTELTIASSLTLVNRRKLEFADHPLWLKADATSLIEQLLVVTGTCTGLNTFIGIFRPLELAFCVQSEKYMKINFAISTTRTGTSILCTVMLVPFFTFVESSWSQIQLRNASYRHQWEDLLAPGISVRRVYSSRSLHQGVFGFGWSSNFDYIKVSTWLKVKQKELFIEIDPTSRRIKKISGPGIRTFHYKYNQNNLVSVYRDDDLRDFYAYDLYNNMIRYESPTGHWLNLVYDTQRDLLLRLEESNGCFFWVNYSWSQRGQVLMEHAKQTRQCPQQADDVREAVFSYRISQMGVKQFANRSDLKME